jgi:hypothetical protein
MGAPHWPPAQEHPLTPASLRRRIDAFAHDSLGGRAAGTTQFTRAAQLIEREMTRLGLGFAGSMRSFRQPVPLVRRWLDTRSLALGYDDQPYPPYLYGELTPATDFLPAIGWDGVPLPVSANAGPTQVIFGGELGQERPWVTPDSIRGRFIVVKPPTRNGAPDIRFDDARALALYAGARAVFITTLDLIPPTMRAWPLEPRLYVRGEHAARPIPPVVLVTPLIGGILLGTPVDSAKAGEVSRRRTYLRFSSRESSVSSPTWNLVGMVEGSDASLRRDYVVLVAHADHLGFAGPVDRVGADSVFNGADDNGTGVVALLAIAEQFARANVRPRRSVLFVWTAAGEPGSLGSRYFADNVPVARDRIVAAINVDMIGRGGSTDTPGGGPGYVEVVGGANVAEQFGALADSANRSASAALQFEYVAARDGYAEQLFCHGDHWGFARHGIPSLLVTTGTHRDYHAVTDEAATIDYEKLTRVTRFVAALVEHVANQRERPPADGRDALLRTGCRM